MEKLLERSRRQYYQWRNISSQTSNSRSVPMTGIVNNTPIGPGMSGFRQPDAFLGAHPILRDFIQDLQFNPPAPSIPHMSGGDLVPERRQPWLPTVYGFTSNGIGVDERYNLKAISPSSNPPTPFAPSTPRVDPRETFNFDHGALTAQLEETSYMAWF